MKKIIFFLLFQILCLLSFNSFSYSQFGWYWSLPTPTGSHLEDVFFHDVNTGYAVGWDGTIIKTLNGGTNWFQLNSEGNRILTSIFFVNENTGYVTSGNYVTSLADNYIMKTTNAGINWNQLFTFNNSYLSSIKFVNDTIGFIVGGIQGGRIYKTTNVGINWVEYFPTPTVNQFFSIFFTSENVGYVAGDGGKILKTTNCGVNWFSLSIGNEYTKLNAIYFINFYTGFVCGSGGKIYKTTNEGLNWNTINTGITDELRDIKFKDFNTGFVSAGGTLVQENGKILKTTDAGNSWTIMNINNIQNFRRISVNNENIIAVGYWGAIVKSFNSGINWNSLNSPKIYSSINDIYVLDSLKCIAVGDSSKIYSTNDGGKTWQIGYLQGNYNYQLISIDFINSNTGFISGGINNNVPPFSYGSSKIYKTTNAGISWNLIYGTAYENGIMYDVKFLSANIGFSVGGGVIPIGGTSGKIIKTTNGGLNWQLKNYGTNDCIYSISIIDSLITYVCGTSGKIFKTTNGGDNWVMLSTGISSTLFSICFTNINTGYACSYNQIIKTTNGGMNWISTNNLVPYGFDINKIKFINQYTGFAVGISYPESGRAGDIIRTTNSGLNWQHMTLNNYFSTIERRGIRSIDFLNNKIGYIVGEYGAIFKTTNGGDVIISVNNNHSYYPKSYLLSQNFPNPFNPKTKIKYNVPEQTHVNIIIYNSLGKFIEVLLNENLKPGSYEIEWDGSKHASGLYFYELISNKFHSSGKMILLK